MSDKETFGHKTDRGWHFDDKYLFEVISHTPVDASIKDNFGTMSATGHNPAAHGGIIVKIAATHAGLVTRNNGFYMPDRMRAGAPTWTATYNKPIQVHHNDHSDPIGRVISARYVDTSPMTASSFKNFALRDSMKREVGKADEAFWSKFISDKTSFIQKLQMIKLMDSVLQDSSYQGVGYIELTAHITDPAAVQKILDGRYITGSVGATSNKAVCSICDTDWVESEHCGHRPGKLYDGRKCVVVAGDLEYDEYSFVNTPADRHSGVLRIENSVDKVQDSISNFFPIFDSVKEASIMNANVDGTTTEESTVVIADAIVEIKPEVTPVSFDSLFNKVLAGEVTEEESEKLYDFLVEEMDPEIIQDAKLSVESRKKLPATTFCGPGKSFPVPDCAHVTAARRLIGRYKGEGSKDSILACVSRKAKAMGCESKDEVVPVDESTITDEAATAALLSKPLSVTLVIDGEVASVEEKLSIVSGILDTLSTNFSEVLADAITSKNLIAKDSAVNEEVSKLSKEVEKYEDIIGSLRDELKTLKMELKSAYSDVTAVEDQLISTKLEARALKVDKLNTLSILDGKKVEVSEIQSLTDEALDNTLINLDKSLDMVKIADKLTNGLSRTPQEQVEAPTGLTETPKETKPSQTPTYQTQKWVDEVYRKVLLQDGSIKADQYYAEQVKYGRAFPKN